jgi:hypothetical protein
MQLKMLRRRTDSASSLSLTGDLAQATGVVVYETWPDITNYLSDDEPIQEKLIRSYRVPKEILTYANQFLELSEVRVDPAEPFLERPNSLNLHQPFNVQSGTDEAERIIAENLVNERSVLLVGNSDVIAEFKNKKFEIRGKAHFKAYPAREVKGLEFDVVIILNPGDILDELLYESSKSARLMYVLSTRSTQQLHVIGRNSMEVKKPIQYYEKMDLKKEEIEITLNDIELDLLGNETSESSEYGKITEAISSIPVLCSDFNLEIHTTDPDLNSNGWFYVGLTQGTRCIACNFKQQQVFRRHISVKNKVSHPGAFVCLGCLVARHSTEYGQDVLKNVDFELLQDTSVENLCLDCAK